jgi:type IV secretory pathway VirJ component
MIAGIDNGVSGAVTIINDHGALVAWTPMPVRMLHGKRAVDVLALWAWLTEATGDKVRECRYIIERPVGSKSANAAKSMQDSFARVWTLLEVRGCMVEAVAAKTWQKRVFQRLNGGDGNTKVKALRCAGIIWPCELWLRTSRCSVAHDGAVDAALIAWWYLWIGGE